MEHELSNYEQQQVKLIKEWKNKEPSIVSQGMGKLLYPLTWMAEKVIPEAAIRGLLDFSSTIAKWLTDTSDILRDGRVASIKELKAKDIELSDELSNEVHNWAIGIATVEGGATGTTGLPGIAADVPAIITIALRTIHKIGVCYGFEAKTTEDRDFIRGIMAASGANDMSEKLAALATLRSIEVTIAKQTWKKMAQTAAQSQMSKEAAIIGLKNLAKQLGVNLTKRKALQTIPIVGAVVGASVNGWYIKDVGWAARRAFQERWLIENEKIIEI